MKIIKIISYLLVLIGFVGFIGGVLISSRVIDYKSELPLGAVNSLVVNNKGLIFIGLGFYGKVQVYDANGTFLRNWDVDNDGGAFNLVLDKEFILVKEIRKHGWDRYDEFGKLNGGMDVFDGVFNGESSSSFIDEKKNFYEITGFMFSQVKRNGKTLINQNLFLKIIKGPFPAWIFAMLGIITLVYLNLKKLKK